MAWSLVDAVNRLSGAGEPTRLRILALLEREELAVVELCRILEQSQPRVSRHLKILAEAGLVERFPDGAWVFYRLPMGGESGALARSVLRLLDPDDGDLRGDLARLRGVRDARVAGAAAYFAGAAPRWAEMRAFHVDEAEVEAAILAAAGPGPFARLIDLGTGTGRMLTLLAPRARRAQGLDLSQQMLNVARAQTAAAGLSACELRHGDIRATGLPDACADLVVVHQVLHYLADPAVAVAEAARLVAPGGRLLVIDFARHELEFLREAHQHRRLGFADLEIARWLRAAGLEAAPATTLPPPSGRPGPGLTVKIWSAPRAPVQERLAS